MSLYHGSLLSRSVGSLRADRGVLFGWQEDLEHEDHCAICQEDGELQPCHNCTRAYHPDCLQPPLRTPPRGAWYCPKCQKKVLRRPFLE